MMYMMMYMMYMMYTMYMMYMYTLTIMSGYSVVRKVYSRLYQMPLTNSVFFPCSYSDVQIHVHDIHVHDIHVHDIHVHGTYVHDVHVHNVHAHTNDNDCMFGIHSFILNVTCTPALRSQSIG